MQVSFKTNCVLILEHSDEFDKPRHVLTKFNLSVSGNLDEESYIGSDGLPTCLGCKAITNVLVQALIGNIHNCHENSYIDSAKHLRHIISELERGFSTVSYIRTTTINE